MDMFYDVEGLEACYYMESYDMCDEFNEESNYCNAWITFNGEDYEVTCEEAEAMFYGDDSTSGGDDDDCWEYIEDDCMAMWIEESPISSCSYSMWVDMCMMEGDDESCYAYMTIDGMDVEGNCGELEEQFAMYVAEDDYDDEGSYSDDCWEWIEDDCMHMFGDVEGLESCSYTMWYDACYDEDDMESCTADILYHGEEMTLSCSEAEAMFYGESHSGSDDESTFCYDGEPVWHTDYPSYEDETYPQVHFPAEMSSDVYFDKVCFGGRLWDYDYCGWKFTLNTGEEFPPAPWNSVEE